MFRLHQRRGPNPANIWVRGHSSAGRALRWQRRGQGFDPPWLHHFSLVNQAKFVQRRILIRGGHLPIEDRLLRI